MWDVITRCTNISGENIQKDVFHYNIGECLDWDSQSLYMAAILENGGPNPPFESRAHKRAPDPTPYFDSSYRKLASLA